MPKPFLAVLVATQTEFEAARSLLREHYRTYSHFGYRSLLADLDTVFLVIQLLNHMGNIDAAVGTSTVIRDYRPICVVGAGMCCGVRGILENPNYCDIIVSSNVIYYEPSRKALPEDEFQPQRFDTLVPQELRNKICPPRDQAFAHAVPERKPAPRPRCHHGSYASGESVIQKPAFVEDLRSKVRKVYNDDIAAIEMEGAGIAAACHHLNTKFLIVKAISDFAEQGEDKYVWQNCAASVSLASVIDWARSLTEADINELQRPAQRDLGTEDAYQRATKAAVLAGRALPARGVSPEQVMDRNVDDLVSYYDTLCEDFLKESLCRAGEQFIGEERSEHDETHRQLGPGRWWVVDAVDGTQNMIVGRPEVAVSIASLLNMQPETAVVHLPYRGRTVGACKATGLEVNGLPWARKRQTATRLDEAVVALPGDLRRFRRAPEESQFQVEKLTLAVSARAKGIRITGALAYDLACVALGEFDARISTSAKLVDVAAGATLVRAAGGKVTDINGETWRPGRGMHTIVAAATPELHAEILSLVKEGKEP